MGYLEIKNLYKAPDLLIFKRVFALEKIHGTSAHVSWSGTEVCKNHEVSLKRGVVHYSPGGESYDAFRAVFDEEGLVGAFEALGHDSIQVFGEFYGGRCMGMSETYGQVMRFAAFDVQIGGVWLNVPNAADVVKKLGLEFVHFVEVDATVEALDRERDAPSVQAARNGATEPKIREGIVVRPPIELTRSNGSRMIAKHKRVDFQETGTERPVDPEQIKVLADAERIAEEWVTDRRLEHVLDKVVAQRRISGGDPTLDMKDTGEVVRAMLADVRKESDGEIAWTKEAEREVGRRAALLFKKSVARVG